MNFMKAMKNPNTLASIAGRSIGTFELLPPILVPVMQPGPIAANTVQQCSLVMKQI